MKNDVEATRQQIHAQLLALQELAMERTRQLLAAIARQTDTRAKVEEELQLLDISVGCLELRAAATK